MPHLRLASHGLNDSGHSIAAAVANQRRKRTKGYVSELKRRRLLLLESFDILNL